METYVGCVITSAVNLQRGEDTEGRNEDEKASETDGESDERSRCSFIVNQPSYIEPIKTYQRKRKTESIKMGV